jgi:hypothetical protein
MTTWIPGVLAVAVALAVSGAASQRWQTDSPPTVEDQHGGRLTFDQPLAALEGGGQQLEYGSGPDLGNPYDRSAAGCPPGLDSRKVTKAVLAVFTGRGLAPGYLFTSDRQVILVSQVKTYGGIANFYSFVADLKSCSNRCSLYVSAHLFKAPVLEKVILLSRAVPGDNDLSNALSSATASAFDSCT